MNSTFRFLSYHMDVSVVPILSNVFRLQTIEKNINVIGKHAKTALIIRESRMFREINSVISSKHALNRRNYRAINY